MPTHKTRPLRWYERDSLPTDPRLWLYGPVPAGFWQERENRHRYMDWLGEQLGFTRLEDWYQLSLREVEQRRGRGLLKHVGDSPLRLLQDYRPDYAWQEWRFATVPTHFWSAAANRRRYLDWVGQQLGFRRTEDWYGLTYDALLQHHGARLLALFADSPSAVLRDYQPDYDWKEWLLPQPPQGFWGHTANRRRYLDWLGHQLGFQCPADWARLWRVDILRHRGQGLLKRFQHDLAATVHEYLTLRSRPRRPSERAAPLPPRMRTTKGRMASGPDD